MIYESMDYGLGRIKLGSIGEVCLGKSDGKKHMIPRLMFYRICSWRFATFTCFVSFHLIHATWFVAIRQLNSYRISFQHAHTQIVIYTHTRPFSSHYTPSSIPTFLHHGTSPLPSFCANISSASPTCRLSLTSLLSCPLSFSFMAFIASMLVGREPVLPRANPREPERMSSLCVHPPSLMTGNCYWRGSEDEERRFKCR
jgi:hypothetical protein